MHAWFSDPQYLPRTFAPNRHSFGTSSETLFRKRAVIKFPEREIATRCSISCENRSGAPAVPGLVKSRTGRFFNRARVSPPRSHVDKGNAFYGLVKTSAREGRTVLRGLAKAILGGELQLVGGSELSPHVRRSFISFRTSLDQFDGPAVRHGLATSCGARVCFGFKTRPTGRWPRTNSPLLPFYRDSLTAFSASLPPPLPPSPVCAAAPPFLSCPWLGLRTHIG